MRRNLIAALLLLSACGKAEDQKSDSKAQPSFEISYSEDGTTYTYYADSKSTVGVKKRSNLLSDTISCKAGQIEFEGTCSCYPNSNPSSPKTPKKKEYLSSSISCECNEISTIELSIYCH